jgi:hypothetical protein
MRSNRTTHTKRNNIQSNSIESTIFFLLLLLFVRKMLINPEKKKEKTIKSFVTVSEIFSFHPERKFFYSLFINYLNKTANGYLAGRPGMIIIRTPTEEKHIFSAMVMHNIFFSNQKK